jgi:hypothetical protein
MAVNANTCWLYNKLAYALQTVDILAFGWRYTGRYLQLSNDEPTLDCSAPAASQLTHAHYSYSFP